MVMINLRTKVLLSLAGVVVLVAGLLLVFAVDLFGGLLDEERIQHQHELADMFAEELRELDVHAPLARTRALNIIRNRSGLQGIFIVNPFGDALGLGEREALAQLATNLPLWDLVEGRVKGALVVGEDGRSRVAALAAILDEESREVGHLLVISPVDVADRHYSEGIALLVLFTLLLSVLMVGVGAFMLDRIVVRPLRRLIRATERAQGVEGSASRETIQRASSAPPPSDDLMRLEGALARLRDRMATTRVQAAVSARETRSVDRALRSAQETLVRTEKLASVGVLTAGIAHEIGNPIGIILGFLDVLGAPECEVSDQEKALEQIRLATERIDTLIRDLLRFSRATESHDGESVADISGVIERVLQLLSPQKRLKRIVIGTEDLTPGLRAEIEPEKLEQILVNLILNAADAMGSEGSLRLRSEIMGPHVHVAVCDGGPGIPAGKEERIFEPFFTTKVEGEGTGLGLAISRHIAVSHNGDVYVESTGPEGTTFIVQLWREDWDAVDDDSANKP